MSGKIVFLILLIINTRIEAYRNRGMNAKSKYNPMLIILDSEETEGARIYKHRLQEDRNKDFKQKDESNVINNEDSAYLIYHLLRTTQQTSQLDPQVHEAFEETKEVLRQAFRSKCEKLKKCVQVCPEEEKDSCEDSCEVKHNYLSLCEEPKKRGKTLPPSWKKGNYCC